ncbi:helix-turn-helix transcriptional regulator [Desulfoscipio sp. XC116]|uniref:helix-turn-helix domain-containing protein n=1 Tax=Desulfoscipio sp. XC116 TaxID=3144975 RepID=UPI00325C1AEC
MDLTGRLKSLREEKSLTQEGLAKTFKISRSAVTKYEAGERRPDPVTLQTFADYYDVSVDYLLGRTDIRETPEKIIESSLQDDPKLLEFWSELKSRKDLQLLFKQVIPMTPEGVKKVIRIIKALEEEPLDKGS